MNDFQTPPSGLSAQDVYLWGDVAKGDSKKIFGAPVLLPFRFPDSIKKIVGGPDFYFFLLNNGRLYGFGNNFYGQLGIRQRALPEKQHVKTEWVARPMLIDFLPPGENVRDIAAGATHTLLLSSSGTVYSAGCNMYFQLGNQKSLRYFDQTEHTRCASGKHSPSMIPFRDKWEEVSISNPVSCIAAGKWNSYAVTVTGEVFSFGTAARGALGHPKGDNIDFIKGEIKSFFNRNAEELCTIKYPQRIESLYHNGIHISKVCAGEDHALLLADDKHIFSCGESRFGRLGINQVENVLEPLESINKNFPERSHAETVIEIFAAGKVSYVIRQSEKGDSFVYIFGQLLDDSGILTPTLIPELCGENITGVSSTGTSHIAWNESGEVFVWGKSAKASSSGIKNFYASRAAQTTPTKSGLFSERHVVLASCGSHATFVVTESDRDASRESVSLSHEIFEPFVQILHAKMNPGIKELSLSKHLMQLPENANLWRQDILGQEAGSKYDAQFNKEVEATLSKAVADSRTSSDAGWLSDIGKELLGARSLDTGYKVKVWMDNVYALGVILTRLSGFQRNGTRVSEFRVRWLREDWVDEDIELNSDDEIVADDEESENPNRWMHGWKSDACQNKALY